MLQIDDAAVLQTHMICDDTPKQATAFAFDSWKYKHFNFIWSK